MPSDITLSENEDGTFTAVYPWTQYRFLLQGGDTIDVIAIRDEGWLRETVLAHTKAAKIEGVTAVAATQPVEEAVPEKPRKVPAKKIGQRRAVAS